MNVRARKMAVYVLFLIPGLGISSWVTRTPAIRDVLGASTMEMGIVLFGLSAGSMIGILSSGPLVNRAGARSIVALGMATIVVSMPLVGLGVAVSSSIIVGAGLLLFGFGMGGGEIAMNVEGSNIERITGRPFLPSLHGFFSLGTVIGATAGIAFTAWDFSAVWHLMIVGAVAFTMFVASIRHLPEATGKVPPGVALTGRRRRSRPKVWKDPRLMLIGLIVLAMSLTEGTANDWLPLVMVDGHGVDQSLGSAVYAVFAASMAFGRFLGGGVVIRLGRTRVLAASAVSAAIGLAVVALVDSQVVAGIAVIFWGLGASLGFPVAVSAAGDSGPGHKPEGERASEPDDAEFAARVSFVATLGYLAFLVGPPVLGLIGEAITLRGALLVPMALVLGASLLTPAAKEAARRPEGIRAAIS